MRTIIGTLLFVSVFCFASSIARAAESHYEVYYFHASWRCGNCTTAEALASEAVASVRASNPDVTIVFTPKQLETNTALVQSLDAKRVDLAIVEVKDGEILRALNIGNLLPLVGNKNALLGKVKTDIIAFMQPATSVSR